jgi:hypothetical protein
MKQHMAVHNFRGEKGEGLITCVYIAVQTVLLTVSLVSINEDDIPAFYSPNTVLTYDKKKFIDPEYTSVFNRPFWTYMNSAPRAESANVRTVFLYDENKQLIGVEFRARKNIPKYSELLLFYTY